MNTKKIKQELDRVTTQRDILARQLNAVRKVVMIQSPCETESAKAVGSSDGLSGVELIKSERLRQISQEGWSTEHDDGHKLGELASAAESYAHQAAVQANFAPSNILRSPPQAWPWSAIWWKPSDDQIRNLVKAGALIAAEIDRLQRLKSKPDNS